MPGLRPFPVKLDSSIELGLGEGEDGGVSYDPDNHEEMTALRAEKVAAVSSRSPRLRFKVSRKAICLSSVGDLRGHFRSGPEPEEEGFSVSSVHLSINPLPDDLGEIMGRFKKVIVPELNLGQLSWILRAKYLVGVISYGKVQGKPFKVSELREKFLEHIN